MVEIFKDDFMIIYTASIILTEFMDRYGVVYSCDQIDQLCENFSSVQEKRVLSVGQSDEELLEKLFGMLTMGIGSEEKKRSGSERTPDEIIEYMLDLIGYEGAGILHKKIIDPACGTGTFVAKIVQRFVNALEKENKVDRFKEKLLDGQLICAYDTKASNVYVTKIVVLAVLIKNHVLHHIEDVLALLDNLPILCEDFLQINEEADYVIGNPPYIRLQNLSNEYREFIKKHYFSAKGRFDIYTCFIEKSDKILNKQGKLCLITSNKYMTANYGIGIRSYLSKKGHVRKIIDLFDTKFFEAAVLPAIILCENSESDHDCIDYTRIKSTKQVANCNFKNAEQLFQFIKCNQSEKKIIVNCEENGLASFEISYSTAKIPKGGKTWNFSSASETKLKDRMDAKKYYTLGDIFDICVGIKTTADCVFVKPMTESFIKERGLEPEVIYPLIQSFDVDKWTVSWGKHPKDRYILYPHKENQGNMYAIPLEHIPKAKQYLEECSNILKNRSYLSESKTREWYECWVPQKLSKFRKPKIVTRDIVSHNTFAFDNSGMLCQGNTFFLTRKSSVFAMEYISMTDEQYCLFILGMLNSRVMEYYQKMISGCLYSDKYRYTTTNLNRWPIPRVGLKEAIGIADLVRQLLCKEKNQECIEKQIDDIMYRKFGFEKEEITEIESFINVAEQEKSYGLS